MKIWFLGASIAIMSTSADRPAQPVRSQGDSAHARVAVAIVIDQFAAWVAEERLSVPVLPAPRGFGRLLKEGTWVRRSEYPYANTETAPGHASLFTGMLPSEHGVVANYVWREDLKKSATLIQDSRTSLVGAEGPIPDKQGVSGSKMSNKKGKEARTIASRLLDLDGSSTVISLSLKDRAAFFGSPWPLPRSIANVSVVWQDETSGQLVTTSPYRLPNWARLPDTPNPLTWDLTFDQGEAAFVQTHAKTEDKLSSEDDSMGGPAFPHTFRRAPNEDWKKFRATPLGDELLVELALGAVEQVCPRHVPPQHCDLRHPLLLSISFSTNDYVGHRFGPDSWEAWDEFYRLDWQLQRLFDGLDERLGSDAYSVVLTGDHGMGPLPETSRTLRDEETRKLFELPGPQDPEPVALNKDKIARLLRDALAGPPIGASADVVQDVSDTLVTLNSSAVSAHTGGAKDKESMLRKTIKAILTRLHGVETVYDLNDDICAKRPNTGDAGFVYASTLCESGTGGGPDRSKWGDFYIVTQKGSFFTSSPYRASHGTPYLYDRTVPLIVRYADGAREVGPKAATGFGAFYASLWYALTGKTEVVHGEGPVGRDEREVSATILWAETRFRIDV